MPEPVGFQLIGLGGQDDIAFIGMPSEELNIGDLVVCKYDFEELYYPFQPYVLSKIFFVGIIVDCRKHAIYPFDRDTVYEVLCTDGVHRSFMNWEVEILRKPNAFPP